VTLRVGYARELVAAGHRPAVVARILRVSRRAVYRTPKPRRAPDAARRRPIDDVEAAIVQVAEANPTDGYRLVTAWVARKVEVALHGGRVLRVMRERKLIQRRTHEPKRRRPGFFQLTRPGELWHLDMTSIWVAEHGWVYLNAIIDCLTREIVGWQLSLRYRAKQAIAVIETAVRDQGILPGTLTLGSDNGSAFTARATRLAISGLGVRHRRGGYRDPESQAFIESSSRHLNERRVWRHESETLNQAREMINGYINHYHHRPHNRPNHRTPTEARNTSHDAQDQPQNKRPDALSHPGFDGDFDARSCLVEGEVPGHATSQEVSD
jgi:putative transposase